MSEPAEFNPDVTPAAILAGVAWPVKPLGWRAMKHARAELLELSGRIRDAMDANPSDPEAPDFVRAAHNAEVLDEVFEALTNDEFDSLVVGPIVAALRGLHPGLTREEVEAWPVLESEWLGAWLVVRGQSGLFVRTQGGDSSSGEDGGAA